MNKLSSILSHPSTSPRNLFGWFARGGEFEYEGVGGCIEHIDKGGSQSYTRARSWTYNGKRSEEEDVGGDVEQGVVFARQEGFGAEAWIYSHSAAYVGDGSVGGSAPCSVHLLSTPPITVTSQVMMKSHSRGERGRLGGGLRVGRRVVRFLQIILLLFVFSFCFVPFCFREVLRGSVWR